MGRSIFQEILLFITYLLLAVLCLPVFFIFLRLADNSIPVSEMLILPYIIGGLVIILLNIYFGRWLLLVLKSIKA